MNELRPISFVFALFCLTAPVVTWAASCPEGQKWNDRQGECVIEKKGSSKEKKSITNKNPAEVEKWKFGGAKWFATTTGGIEDSIMGHGDEVKFVLHTDRCIRNPAAVGKYRDDCDRGIFRTQLRSHHSYPINSRIVRDGYAKILAGDGDPESMAGWHSDGAIYNTRSVLFVVVCNLVWIRYPGTTAKVGVKGGSNVDTGCCDDVTTP